MPNTPYTPYTTEQELDLIGIDTDKFNEFYQKLEKDKQIPIRRTLSPEDSATILTYLKMKRVLDKNENILEQGFKVFSSKKRIEDLVREDKSIPMGPMSSGGLVSCRDYNPLSSGGIAPCRNDYEDDYGFGLPGLVTEAPED